MQRAVWLWVAAALASFVSCAADALKHVEFVMKDGVVFKSAVGMDRAP